MARFGNVEELATFLGKLDADYAEYAPALWQKGIKTARQLANFSHIILLVVCQRGTLMTLKQDLIQQVSCWLATLYISILAGMRVTKLYRCTCGVGNPVHVAQGFAVGRTAIRRRRHKKVK